MTMVLGPAKKTGSAKKAAPKAAVKEKIGLAEKSTGGK